MNEIEKMKAGVWYDANYNEELLVLRRKAMSLVSKLNQLERRILDGISRNNKRSVEIAVTDLARGFGCKRAGMARRTMQRPVGLVFVIAAQRIRRTGLGTD